jgi:hypothetical protein
MGNEILMPFAEYLDYFCIPDTFCSYNTTHYTTRQRSDVEIFNLKKLNDVEVEEQYPG